MANTFTSYLRLPLLDDGNVNVWGGVLNSALRLIEDATTGILDVDVTSSDVTLTEADGRTDQARFKVLRITGDPGIERTVIVPRDVPKIFVVINDTNPGFTVRISSLATNVAVEPGEVVRLWMDGLGLQINSINAPNNSVTMPVNSAPTLVSVPSVPASGTMQIAYDRVGNMVMGSVLISATPTLSTGTVVFDTSPTALAALAPPYDCDFPCLINESGTARYSFLRIPAGGGDWTFNRCSGTFGAVTTRSMASISGFPVRLPFAYPLV